MSRLKLFACLACLVAGTGLASADTMTYAVTSTGRFGYLNLDTGDFLAVGDVAHNGYNGIGDLAGGTLVGVDGANNFVEIDATDGTISVIGPTGITVYANGSTLRGGQYAIDVQNALYQIDPVSGAATLVGPTGIPGLDLNTFANAVAGNRTTLYYIYEQGGSMPVPSTLYQIDTTTGAATAIGPTGVTGIVGAGFVNGTLYAYGSVASSGGYPIYTIDVTTGTATDTGVRSPSTFLLYGSNSGGF